MGNGLKENKLQIPNFKLQTNSKHQKPNKLQINHQHFDQPQELHFRHPSLCSTALPQSGQVA